MSNQSPISAYESSIAASPTHEFPCAYPAESSSDLQPSPHHGAKDVFHHAAEGYIANERLDQVERLVEGVGSRAAHFIPETVASTFSSYWFGTSSPTASVEDTTTEEHEKGRSTKAPISSCTKRIKQRTNLPLVVLSSLVITPAAFSFSFSSRPLDVRLRVFAVLTMIYSLLAVVDQATSTSPPANVEGDIDDAPVAVVVPEPEPARGIELAPAAVLSQDEAYQEEPDGGVHLASVVSSPPRPAPAPVELEGEVTEAAPVPEPTREPASAQRSEPASAPSASQEAQAAPVTVAVATQVPDPEPAPDHETCLPQPRDEGEAVPEAVVTPVPEPAQIPAAEEDEPAEAAPTTVVSLVPEPAQISPPVAEDEPAKATPTAAVTPVPERAQTPIPVAEDEPAKVVPSTVVVTPVPEPTQIPAPVAEDGPVEVVPSTAVVTPPTQVPPPVAEDGPVEVVPSTAVVTPLPEPTQVPPPVAEDELAEAVSSTAVVTPVPEPPQIPPPVAEDELAEAVSSTAVVTAVPELAQIPASVVEYEPVEATLPVAVTPVSSDPAPRLASQLPAQITHEEDHTTQSNQEITCTHDADAVPSARRNETGISAEESVRSAMGTAPTSQEGRVKGDQTHTSTPTTDTNTPISAPTTPSKATTGSTDGGYHPAALHPISASYSNTSSQAATTPSLGSTSPSPSMRDKGHRHSHFLRRTNSNESQESGSTHGRKKVGFFDKVRGEAKVIIGKIEHKKEKVEAGKRILHGDD